MFSVAATIVLWASAFVAIRIGVRSYGPGELALLRYLVASAILALIALRNPRVRTLVRDPRCLIIVGLCGVTGIAVYNVLLNWGERSVPSAEASFLVNLGPIFTAIFACTWLGERFGFTAWAGSLLAFGGASIIALTGNDGFNVSQGAIFVLVAAAFQAMSFVLQRNILKEYAPFEVAAVSIWIGTLSLCGFSPNLVAAVPAAGLASTLAVLYLGVFPGALAYVCWSYVLSAMPSSKAAQFLYVVPIVTLLLGWLTLNERPTANDAIGGALILVGVAVTRLTLPQSFRTRRPRET